MVDNISLPNDLDSSFTSSMERSDHLNYNIDHNNFSDWWTETPSAPSPGLVLFNSEEQSDLIFIVTMDSDEDSLKFPGHSFIIKDSSPIFENIVHQIDQGQRSTSDSKPIIHIQCRPETLHNLMSYIYKKEVILNSVTSCLALLELSIKFMLTELTSTCLTFLCNNANEFNVLLILSTLSKIDFKPFQPIKRHSHKSNRQPQMTMLSVNQSSTSEDKDDGNPDSNNNNSNNNNMDENDINNIVDDDNRRSRSVRSSSITSVICLTSEGQQSLSQFSNRHYQQIHHPHRSNEIIQNLVNELISRCYCILDEYAESIISSEAICSLDRNLLIKILSRDTLKLSSEMITFQAIERWSVCQCQRELTEINGPNKIAALGCAVYSVRYLTMPLMVFTRGPFVSDLLTEMDKNYLQSKLLDPDTKLPPHLTGLKLDVKRKWIKPNKLIPTSSTSTSTSSSAIRPYFSSSSSSSKKTVTSSSSSTSTSSSSSSSDQGSDRKKKPAIKKFLNGLGDVMIFAIRIFD